MILVPRIASENTGKRVPQNTAKHMTTNIMLLNRNPLSLDVKDSIFLVDLKSFLLKYIIPKETIIIENTKVKKIGPNEDPVNE